MSGGQPAPRYRALSVVSSRGFLPTFGKPTTLGERTTGLSEPKLSPIFCSLITMNEF
jgi:hypothetical protein